MKLLKLVFIGVFFHLASVATAATIGYVTNQGSNSVSVLDLDNFQTIDEIKVGLKPAGVVVSPDKTRVYVTNPESKSISVIDTATNQLVQNLGIGDGHWLLKSAPMAYLSMWRTGIDILFRLSILKE